MAPQSRKADLARGPGWAERWREQVALGGMFTAQLLITFVDVTTTH